MYVDHRRDNGALLGGVVPPEMIPTKVAGERPVYALGDARVFPIHTPEDASMSLVYATIQGAPDELRRKIAASCLAFGVDVTALGRLTGQAKLANAPVPEPADNDLYAIPEVRRLRIATRDETVKAAQALVAHGRGLPVETRTIAARRIYKQAQHFGVVDALPQQACAMAGVGQANRAKLSAALRERAYVAAQPYAEEYQQASTEALHLPEHALRDDTYLRKLAATIDDLDAKSGLKPKLAALRLVDPVQAVYAEPKRAAHTVKVAGRDVPLDRLASLPHRTWMKVAGPELTARLFHGQHIDVRSIPTVVGSLPLDVARGLLDAVA